MGVSPAEKIKSFLLDFVAYSHDDENEYTSHVYREELTRIAHREQVALSVDLDHVLEFDVELCVAIEQNTRRFVAIFSDAINELIPEVRTRATVPKDTLDIYIEHRMAAEQRHHPELAYNSERTDFAPCAVSLTDRFAHSHRPRSPPEERVPGWSDASLRGVLHLETRKPSAVGSTGEGAADRQADHSEGHRHARY